MLDELFGGGSSPESNPKSQTPSQAIFDFSDPEPEKPDVEIGEFSDSDKEDPDVARRNSLPIIKKTTPIFGDERMNNIVAPKKRKELPIIRKVRVFNE